MKESDNHRTFRLFGKDIDVPRIDDQYPIFSPIPLRSLPPSTSISSMNGFGIQESWEAIGPVIDDGHNRNFKKQGSCLKSKPLVLKKKDRKDCKTNNSKLFGVYISEEKKEKKKRQPVPKKSNNSTKKKGEEIQESRIPLPPTIIQEIESNNGTSPVFLYRKQLQPSDTKSYQGRLLITRHEKLVEFLNDEEIGEIFMEGLKILSLDPNGEYQNLRLVWWKSVGKFVLNEGWNGLVSANGLKDKCFVEIWCYRRPNNECRLVVNFAKPEQEEEEADHHNIINNGSSSGDTNVGSIGNSSGVLSL